MCYYKIKELKFIVLLSVFAIIKQSYTMCSARSEYRSTIKIKVTKIHYT